MADKFSDDFFNVLKYIYIVILYYWMIFVSMISDIVSNRISSLKPVPYVERKDFVAVVTGGGRGLGAHVVKKLLKCGMTVVAGVRNPNKCKHLLEEVAEFRGKFCLMELDISNMKSVRKFSEDFSVKFNKLNILVNNAGIIYRDIDETSDGFDPILATNYLGHFLLTHLLLKHLEEAGKGSGVKSRIVNVSSCAHVAGTINLEDFNMKKNFIRLGSYGRSKLAQLMASRYIDDRLKSSNLPIMSIAVHPGIVASNMSDDWKGTGLPVNSTLLSEEEGARNVLFCCFSSGLSGGEYFFNDGEGYSSQESRNKFKQLKLFQHTCDMLNIDSFF